MSQTDPKEVPLTELEEARYDELIKRLAADKPYTCLMRVVIDGKPEAVIGVMQSAGEGETDIIPMALLMSKTVFTMIDTPEGAEVIHLQPNKEEN